MTRRTPGLLLLALALPGVLAGQAGSAADSSFRAFLPRWEGALQDMLNGDPRAWTALVSRNAPATLFGPFGGHLTGHDAVVQRYQRAAARMQPSGARVRVEYLAVEARADVAWVAVLERSRYRMAGEDSTSTGYTRATMIFRKEDGEWRIAHRHMDHIEE